MDGVLDEIQQGRGLRDQVEHCEGTLVTQPEWLQVIDAVHVLDPRFLQRRREELQAQMEAVESDHEGMAARDWFQIVQCSTCAYNPNPVTLPGVDAAVQDGDGTLEARHGVRCRGHEQVECVCREQS